MKIWIFFAFFCWFFLLFFISVFQQIVQKTQLNGKIWLKFFDGFSRQSVSTFCGSTNTLSIPNFGFRMSFDLRSAKELENDKKREKTTFFHAIFMKIHRIYMKIAWKNAVFSRFLLFSTRSLASFAERKSKDIRKPKLGIDKVLVDPQNVQTDCPENPSKNFNQFFPFSCVFCTICWKTLIKNSRKNQQKNAKKNPNFQFLIFFSKNHF